MKKIILAASAAAVTFVAVQAGAQSKDERAPTIDPNSASLTSGVLVATQAGSNEPRDERAPKIDLNSA